MILILFTEQEVYEEILKKIPKDETILYKSNICENVNASYKLKSYAYKSLILIFILSFTLIAITICQYLLMLVKSLAIMASIGLSMLLIMIPIFLFLYSTKLKDQFLFVITNERFYIGTVIVLLREMRLTKISLSRIKAVSYRKKLFDGKGDSGTLDVYSGKQASYPRSIRYIKNIETIRKILESILYWYGAVQEQLNKISKKKSNKLPKVFENESGDTLTILDEEIRFNSFVNVIHFGPDTCIDYLVPFYWDVAGAISIKDTHFNDPIIVFHYSGDIQDVHAFCFYHLLTWKAKKGFLLSKEQLKELGEKKYP